jgi:hypothetical protein
MTKYMNRPALTPQQEAEIFPLLDRALELSFGKAIIHKCTFARANYLSRILNGERNRNAILSISTYSPGEPLYGKGLYYHLVIESVPQGLIIGNVEHPPSSLTWKIIECAATRKSVDVSEFAKRTILSRLGRLRERHPELATIFFSGGALHFATPTFEELVVVDIDVENRIDKPTNEDRAKLKQ